MPLAPIRRVAIVGAGVSGVTTAAHLKAEGLDVTVFERAPVAGGVWVWDPEIPLEPTYPSAKPSVAESTFHDPPEKSINPYLLHSGPGPCYDSLRNNVPTELLELSINPWKPNTDSFVTHRVLAEYIQDTAEKLGITKITHFDTRVEHVTKERDRWKIKTRTWDRGQQQRATSQDWTFDAVVVASGHYHAPKVPNIPGLAEWKRAFPSRIQHSKTYRNSKGFENQSILVIGGSASSIDTVRELAPVAKKVWQSTRNGAFDLPASLLPENASRVAEVASFNPLQQHGESSTRANSVTLVDSQVIEDVDRVVVATGYQFSLPFLTEYHRDDLPPQDADGRVLVTDGLQLHNLHKDIFYIPDPTLAFVGVPFYTATFSLFEFQAIAVAAVFSGKTKLPSEAEMRAEYIQRVQDKGYGKGFHSLWQRDVEYAAGLMEWVNKGRAASEKKPDGYSAEWINKKEQMAAVAHPKNLLHTELQV